MENGVSMLERWIFLRVSGISLRVSWFSQASYHHFPWIFLGISPEIFLHWSGPLGTFYSLYDYTLTDFLFVRDGYS